jgi:hypothetical protein
MGAVRLPRLPFAKMRTTLVRRSGRVTNDSSRPMPALMRFANLFKRECGVHTYERGHDGGEGAAKPAVLAPITPSSHPRTWTSHLA